MKIRAHQGKKKKKTNNLPFFDAAVKISGFAICQGQVDVAVECLCLCALLFLEINEAKCCSELRDGLVSPPKLNQCLVRTS